MSPLNRRDFLKGGSMAVVAAGVASAMPMALPSLAGAATPRSAGSERGMSQPEGRLGQPLVAHVRDLHTGEIALFYGDREVTFRDSRLAAELHRAAT
ncbi:MAG: twin-arginine translocation signal domain-containing protein [Acidimicrobiales bacterium]